MILIFGLDLDIMKMYPHVKKLIYR